MLLLHVLQVEEGSHGEPSMLELSWLVRMQVWNALNRYSIDMSKYPAIKAVYDNCVRGAAFAHAAPDQQPDFTG